LGGNFHAGLAMTEQQSMAAMQNVNEKIQICFNVVLKDKNY